MNKSLIEDTSKEIAFRFTGLLDEEAEVKIAKLTDLAVLNELEMIYFQANKEELRVLTHKRIESLGGVAN
jgi:hypothetical protein